MIIIELGQLENQRRGSNGLREIPYTVVYIYIERIISCYRGNVSTRFVICVVLPHHMCANGSLKRVTFLVAISNSAPVDQGQLWWGIILSSLRIVQPLCHEAMFLDASVHVVWDDTSVVFFFLFWGSSGCDFLASNHNIVFTVGIIIVHFHVLLCLCLAGALDTTHHCLILKEIMVESHTCETLHLVLVNVPRQ